MSREPLAQAPPSPPPPRGRRPQTAPGKVPPELERGERADRALRRVLAPLLAAMRATEPGVREAKDPEALHDFRVALRRTRAALGQVRGVFSEAEAGPFRREFAWLGQVTGPRRDHDVLVASLGGYLAELPERVREDLQPLRRFIIEREAHEQEELVAALDSDRYHRLVHGWERFLARQRAASPVPVHATRPIPAVAGGRLTKAARRVEKRARAVGPETPAAEIHRLRIAAKKLRYLVELFASLSPARQVQRLVRALKGLQDVLGAHHDLATQKRSLQAFAEELAASGGAPAATLVATGYLLARLDDRQAKVRKKLQGALAKYLRSTKGERQRRLFSFQEETP